MAAVDTCDLAIVGGGLAGALIALAVQRRRPDCQVRLIEGSGRIGGNHLWSFFGSDVAESDRWLVAPLICHGWKGYGVVFPGQAPRNLDMPYYSIESERLDQVVRASLPEGAILWRRKVLGASANAVVFANGDRLEAQGVIDCRGPGDLSLLDCGWQKFLGRELALSDAHDLARPTVMDATVTQADGYRFVYALPLAATRMFVEDTYYSDTPEVDREVLSGRIQDYALAKGWHADKVIREEMGALPVVMGGDFQAYWRSGGNRVAKGGMRAGLFHPTTGYSLPDAVRLASLIAGTNDFSGVALHRLTFDYARAQWKKRGFYRILDRMLFRAAEPAERWRILARFYTLDAGLIGRFYAGRSSILDKARVLAGKPPVPVKAAIQAVKGHKKQ